MHLQGERAWNEEVEVDRWIVTRRFNIKVEKAIAVTGESRSRHFDRLAEGTNRGGGYFYQMSTGGMFVLTRGILDRLAEFYGESPVWFLTKPD